MILPGILYADMAATVLPAAAALAVRARLTPPRRWIAAWSAILVVANAISLLTALRSVNNHWLNYLVTPVSAAVLLWALSGWQWSPVARLSLRLLIPLFLVTWVAIVLLLEDTQTFSLVAEPFAGLLVLGAAVYTLVSRSFHESGNLFRQDWLWVAGGLALYAGAAIASPPTARWLLATHRELVMRAYELKALLEIVALLLIARGMLCPIPVSAFGGSSWPGSSRSSSSSSASSLPW